MPSPHRPTWAPAMGKDARMNTKQYSSRDIAAHTDLKLELELAESRARALKFKQADEGEQSDKTPSLKQITGDEKGSQHTTEEADDTLKGVVNDDQDKQRRQLETNKLSKAYGADNQNSRSDMVVMKQTWRGWWPWPLPRGQGRRIDWQLSKTINRAGEDLGLPMRGMGEHRHRLDLCAVQVIGALAQAETHGGDGAARTPHIRMRVMEEAQNLLCSSRR
ncbi:hypothetical protein BY996DRAFT_6456343 [Phakopsora pachyrhizi]|uniref:Uncharacterized protein n=1 Tax=Phakopsora pachyrhizi TaxID=170000 RepID=A0AAV0BBH2_PHAPC|nr:hypothetical protein BY996DRAFT_6456343 [Phakopsora pachyrhizi]CAH7684554.1 hypothetical protein PPACK8108_LOCUS18784 [Phakopsora pachyrhizi]